MWRFEISNLSYISGFKKIGHTAQGIVLTIGQRSERLAFDISGRSLSGCGVSRGNGGTVDSWFNNYSTLCFDLTAVN
jgi:hypothetical protein